MCSCARKCPPRSRRDQPVGPRLVQDKTDADLVTRSVDQSHMCARAWMYKYVEYIQVSGASRKLLVVMRHYSRLEPSLPLRQFGADLGLSRVRRDYITRNLSTARNRSEPSAILRHRATSSHATYEDHVCCMYLSKAAETPRHAWGAMRDSLCSSSRYIERVCTSTYRQSGCELCDRAPQIKARQQSTGLVYAHPSSRLHWQRQMNAPSLTTSTAQRTAGAGHARHRLSFHKRRNPARTALGARPRPTAVTCDSRV